MRKNTVLLSGFSFVQESTVIERLSQEQARRHILSRQGLVAPYPSLHEAARAMIAVQTQYPASVGPSLAARAEGVTAKEVEDALLRHRTILKGWSVRNTLHAHLVEDHFLLLSAFGEKLYKAYATYVRNAFKLSDPELDDLHEQLLRALEGKQCGRKELHALVPFYSGRPMVGWGLDVMGLALQGKVVLTEQGAANTKFALMKDWLPEVPLASDDREAVLQVMRRYFTTYGPASYRDYTYWCGNKSAYSAEMFKQLLPELRSCEVEGIKELRYFAGDLEETPGKLPPRLLPKFDGLLMGYRDKSLFLADKFRGHVFRPAGQVEATILLDGVVSGTWRTVRKPKVLEFTFFPFRALRLSEARSLEREAKRTALSLGFRSSVSFFRDAC